MSAIFLASVAILCVVATSVLGLDAGRVGLMLTQSAACNALFQWGVRENAEVENYVRRYYEVHWCIRWCVKFVLLQMTSVERIQQYNSIKPESPNEIPERKPDKSWPQIGYIEFKNVFFAYYDDGPTVLNNLHFKINAKEKVS